MRIGKAEGIKGFKKHFQNLSRLVFIKEQGGWETPTPGAGNKGAHCLQRMKSQELNQPKALLAIHQQF